MTMEMTLDPQLAEKLKSLTSSFRKEYEEKYSPDVLYVPDRRLLWRIRTLQTLESQAMVQLKQAETEFQRTMDAYTAGLKDFDAQRYSYSDLHDLKVLELDFQTALDSFLARFAAFNLLAGARQTCEMIQKEGN